MLGRSPSLSACGAQSAPPVAEDRPVNQVSEEVRFPSYCNYYCYYCCCYFYYCYHYYDCYYYCY